MSDASSRFGNLPRITALLFTAMMGAPVALAIGQAIGAEPVEPIDPVPIEIKLDPRKVELGKQLFFDTRLSGSNGVSCATCHDFKKGAGDGLQISAGLPGFPARTNTPTLFNVALSTKYNWDGHNPTLYRQAGEVLEKKSAMGAKWDEVVDTLGDDPTLVSAFSALYEDGVLRENIIDALVEFERSLITPNAPFDRYLRGEKNAISSNAKAGYQLFKDYGCVSCHQGINIGGNMLQVFGIFGDPPGAQKADPIGSASGSGISSEQPVFRVPTLRNVAETGPYFHDGSAASLSEAISIMAEYQLGRTLNDDDLHKIEEFLKSLSGEIPVIHR